MNRKRTVILLLLTAVLLFGCASSQPEAQTAPKQIEKASGETVATAEAATSTEAAALAQPKKEIRGTGTFDLPQPAVGLKSLSLYKAVLRLSFVGTLNGQPYQVEQVYEQVVDRAQDAWLLNQTTVDASGGRADTFSGLVSGIKYAAVADHPCSASKAAAAQWDVFEPARILPGSMGAREAGQETVDGVAAQVYELDAAALGVSEEDASASGKMWIASQGGWVIQYELRLVSDVVFGEGISGEQTWSYRISEVGTAELRLPESCPQVRVSLPVPANAENEMRLPGSLTYTTQLSTAEVGEFYLVQLSEQGWLQHGDPVETSGGIRWLFSIPVEEGKEWVAAITIEAADGGQQVTIYQLMLDAPPLPAQ
jgi:hypothetical protein